MRRLFWAFNAILMLALVVPTASFCEGTTGAQFLGIGIGSRACAMGESYGALASDPTAIYWNPAGLSQINSTIFYFEQNFWLLDMSHQFIGGAFCNKIGHFGASLYYSSSGDIPKVEDFQKTGEYSAYDMALNLGYARIIDSSISLGSALKYIHEKIESEAASSFAIDLGFQYRIPSLPGLDLAAMIQNIGPKIKFIAEGDKLPFTMGIGASYSRGNFTLASELKKRVDSDLRFGIGGEYVFMKTLAIRAGYNTLRSISLGFGIVWKKFDLGYAFIANKDIDSSHRISLEVSF